MDEQSGKRAKEQGKGGTRTYVTARLPQLRLYYQPTGHESRSVSANHRRRPQPHAWLVRLCSAFSRYISLEGLLARVLYYYSSTNFHQNGSSACMRVCARTRIINIYLHLLVLYGVPVLLQLHSARDIRRIPSSVPPGGTTVRVQ